MASLQVVSYNESHQDAFKAINIEWLESMFYVEPYDLEVLSHPQKHILSQGGKIWVALKDEVVVGTVALMPHPDGAVELTKMGVLKSAQGLGVGRLLLETALKQSRKKPETKTFLLTNTKCEAAIHLYYKYGFVESAEIQKDYGSSYERCNFGMLYAPAKMPR